CKEHEKERCQELEKERVLQRISELIESRLKLEADLADERKSAKERNDHHMEETAGLLEQIEDMATTNRTMEATHGIRLEGLQERCEELESKLQQAKEAKVLALEAAPTPEPQQQEAKEAKALAPEAAPTPEPQQQE
ncbi:unnamed protein product, partial [Polarella glacialis]